ncbi:OmpA family protein [Flavobacteriaceae bacterium KMM 6898]|nr:OmpA family protein [Flavobacteriaceae bacterium KMM 6898]
MKKYAILGSLLLFNASLSAQLMKKLKDKVVSKTEQKAEAKIDHKIDVGIDSVMEGNVHLPSKENQSQTDSLRSNGGRDKAEVTTKVGFEKGYVSKYDFVPGEELVIVEDFADDAIGDFPAKWNTSGSGEIVTIDGLEGKWLMMNNQSNYSFNSLITLPEDYTIQFEIMVSLPFEWRNEPIYFAMADIKNPNNFINTSHYSLNDNRNITFWLNLHPGANTSNFNGYGGYLMNNTSVNNIVNEKLDLKNYFIDKREKLPLKISIWKQKQRIRIYLNENKILDLPKILPTEMNVNALVWQTLGLQEENKYFLGNIRVAASNPDTRNKLLTEGKIVTNGILFGINSDIIKPESYGVIKEIAALLKENKEISIQIIGHTDNDGDEEANQNLSLKRANAVRTMLFQEFGIDSKRMETVGKGESAPIVPNTNAVNKASNRRVEFIKLN